MRSKGQIHPHDLEKTQSSLKEIARPHLVYDFFHQQPLSLPPETKIIAVPIRSIGMVVNIV